MVKISQSSSVPKPNIRFRLLLMIRFMLTVTDAFYGIISLFMEDDFRKLRGNLLHKMRGNMPL